MSVVRANPYLDEIIQILDLHRSKYKSDDEARSYLSKDDNEWIDGEIFHCITEPRYFLSNYYFYRDESLGFRGLYPFFDSQEILHDEFRKLEKAYKKVRAIVNKARQMGYTVYMVGEFLHKTIFSSHTNAIMVSQDEKGANYNMGMYESAYDFLPWWMKPRVNLHQTGTLYNFDERDPDLRSVRSGLKTWVFADNANRPSGVGRGFTFRRALLDELAFWNNASQLSKALMRTFNADDGFYVMGSTGNGRNNAWHNLWRKAESGAIDWHPIYIPFYRRAKTYSIPIPKGMHFELNKDEKEMRDRVLKKENFRISDETFNWMRKTKEEFIATDGDDAMFAQEYTSTAEESFQSSAITAFPRGIIHRLSKRTIEPTWVGEIRYNWDKGHPEVFRRRLEEGEEAKYPESEERFHQWEDPIPSCEYTMGIDVALGREGRDYSVVQVLKKGIGVQKDEQIAVWHGLINPSALAEIVFAIGHLYNEALAAVEVNSYGQQTNSVLMRNLGYENIYRFKRLDRIGTGLTNVVGFWSDSKSTDAYMAKMSEYLLEDLLKINCKYTVDEFNDYTEDGAQGDGAHDDYVDSLCIALYCMHEAEVRDRHEGKKKEIPANVDKFVLVNRYGAIVAETTSETEAVSMMRKKIGVSMQRISGTKANIVYTTKAGIREVTVKTDLQNIDYSPIHDKQGSAHKLHYEEGVEEEEITQEMILEYEAMQEEIDNDPESWRYY